MSIAWNCQGCGQKLKATEKAAGKTVKCPKCGAATHAPPLVGEKEVTDILSLAPMPDAPPIHPGEKPISTTTSASTATTDQNEFRLADEPVAPPIAPAARSFVSESTSKRTTPKQSPPKSMIALDDVATWQKHLHWLLLLALIPLLISLTESERDDKDVMEKVKETMIGAAERGEEVKIDVRTLESLDDLIDRLPGGKLQDAYLPRRTYTHWVFASISATCFFAFFALLAWRGSATLSELAVNGVFTATVGIILLIVFQYIAMFTQGFILRGFNIVALIFWVIKLIGLSYSMALDPESGFFLSFLGFTFGVGLCEEVCKAIPLLFREDRDTWHTTFLWGLASGAGFGISEGITYSADFYNGFAGGNIYLIRFVSCVALHAIFSGSVAITIYHNRDRVNLDKQEFSDFCVNLLLIVGIPMTLHGLYDTLLKKDFPFGALITALVSFGYLAAQIYRYQGRDTKEAREKMFKEYSKRRKQIGA